MSQTEAQPNEWIACEGGDGWTPHRREVGACQLQATDYGHSAIWLATRERGGPGVQTTTITMGGVLPTLDDAKDAADRAVVSIEAAFDAMAALS